MGFSDRCIDVERSFVCPFCEKRVLFFAIVEPWQAAEIAYDCNCDQVRYYNYKTQEVTS